MHPNTLINEIQMINNQQISQARKDDIIVKMIAAAVATAEAVSATPEQLNSNLTMLRKAVAPLPVKSELEQVMAGTQADVPKDGFPPRAADQSATTPDANGDGIRGWFADGNKTGYYALKTDIDKYYAKQAQPATTTKTAPHYDPTGGPGLLAALSGLFVQQGNRERVLADLNHLTNGNAATYVNGASLADPTWNSALLALINGTDPQTVQNRYPAYTLGQLRAANDVIDKYR